MWELAGKLGSILLAFALPYFLFNIGVGIIAIRRSAGSLRAQEEYRGVKASPPDMTTYFLVPCLNEALVIGDTVRDLLHRTDRGVVVVVDDGSDDDTSGIAQAAARELGLAERLLVVRRDLPEARLGKGRALNHAFTVVDRDAARRQLDPESVVVCVLDADGRLSEGAYEHALAEFADERVGAVQLIVRIRNRDRLLTSMQDVEFWAISATSQFARTFTGTVSLGGNGQFTRLSALRALEGDPWSTSLTEDLDLGLRLYARGWRVTASPLGFVHQQGVTNLRTLLRQRTRWYQGHMTAIGRVPELVRSKQLNEVALLEVVMYLLVPWLIVLPWSIIQQLVLVAPFFDPTRWFAAAFPSDLVAGIVVWGLWYSISFLPNLLIGITYSRRTKAVSLPRAIVLGHVMIAYNYIGYLAAWRALFRMLTRRVGWAKTPRSAETPTDPVATSGSNPGDGVDDAPALPAPAPDGVA